MVVVEVEEGSTVPLIGTISEVLILAITLAENGGISFLWIVGFKDTTGGFVPDEEDDRVSPLVSVVAEGAICFSSVVTPELSLKSGRRVEFLFSSNFGCLKASAKVAITVFIDDDDEEGFFSPLLKKADIVFTIVLSP